MEIKAIWIEISFTTLLAVGCCFSFFSPSFIFFFNYKHSTKYLVLSPYNAIKWAYNMRSCRHILFWCCFLFVCHTTLTHRIRINEKGIEIHSMETLLLYVRLSQEIFLTDKKFPWSQIKGNKFEDFYLDPVTKLDRLYQLKKFYDVKFDLMAPDTDFRWQSQKRKIENIPNWPRHALTTHRPKTHGRIVWHKWQRWCFTTNT